MSSEALSSPNLIHPQRTLRDCEEQSDRTVTNHLEVILLDTKKVWTFQSSELPAVEVVDKQSMDVIMRVNEANRKYAEVMKGGLSAE